MYNVTYNVVMTFYSLITINNYFSYHDPLVFFFEVYDHLKNEVK